MTMSIVMQVSCRACPGHAPALAAIAPPGLGWGWAAFPTSGGRGRFDHWLASSMKLSFCLSERGAFGVSFVSHAVNFSLRRFES